MLSPQVSVENVLVRLFVAATFLLFLAPASSGSAASSAAAAARQYSRSYKVHGTVTVGANPVGVVVGSGGYLVANFGGSTVSKVDSTTLKVTQTINVGRAPYWLARMVRSEQTYVSQIYVTNQKDNTVSVFDDYTGKTAATIPVGRLPHGVVTTVPGTSKAYVANAGDNSVTVINQRTLKVVGTIRDGIGSFPTAVAARWSGLLGRTYIFVTNTGSNTISVIDSSTDKVVKTINTFTNYPIGAAAVQSIGSVFVTNQRINTVTEIDGVSHKVVSTTPVGAQPIGVGIKYPLGDPSNTRFDLFVVNSADNTVTILERDERTRTQRAQTVRVGRGPIAVDASGTFVAVTNFHDNSVTFIR